MNKQTQKRTIDCCWFAHGCVSCEYICVQMEAVSTSIWFSVFFSMCQFYYFIVTLLIQNRRRHKTMVFSFLSALFYHFLNMNRKIWVCIKRAYHIHELKNFFFIWQPRIMYFLFCFYTYNIRLYFTTKKKLWNEELFLLFFFNCIHLEKYFGCGKPHFYSGYCVCGCCCYCSSFHLISTTMVY